MNIMKLQEAKKLFEARKYKKACELLFGDTMEVSAAKPRQEVKGCVPEPAPSFELVEGDGCPRTLEKAKAHWFARGCKNARLEDFYALAYDLTPAQLSSIQNDCQVSWLITDKFNYQGKMVSVNGGGYIECPEYQDVLLAEVLSTPEGLKLFQALCGTDDNGESILRKFERLSGTGRGFIRVWTLTMDSRKVSPSRAAGFCYYNGEFHVGGSGDLDYDGRSRGVRCEAR